MHAGMRIVFNNNDYIEKNSGKAQQSDCVAWRCVLADLIDGEDGVLLMSLRRPLADGSCDNTDCCGILLKLLRQYYT